MNRRTQAGFSLIEVLMVLAIVGILAAVAYPSYQSSVQKSRRADAQSVLMGLSQAMERHMTTTGSYTAAAAGGNDEGAPDIFASTSPIDGSQTFYNLTIEDADDSSYMLYATPTGDQSDDGVLGIKSTGEKGWDRDGDGDPFGSGEDCWESSC